MSRSETSDHSSDEQLIDPPLLDFLYYEPELTAFVVAFIPSDEVSVNEKESVNIPLDSAEGRQIGAQLFLLSQLLGQGAVVTRIIHGGGGNYGFHFANGAYVELAEDESDSMHTQQAHDAVRRIAQSAELAFKVTQLSNRHA